MLRYISKLIKYFKDLADTPASYSGQAGKFIKVNSAEDALEYGVAGGGPDKQNLDVKVNAINPAYQIDIDADYLQVQEYNLSSINLTADITSSGANGLDTGAEAANTWYSIWTIYNPTTDTVAGLLSISSTAPTMPSGYTKKRRVGWVRNDGNSDFLLFYQSNNIVQLDVSIRTDNNLTPSTTWTDSGQTIAMTSVIPPDISLITARIRGIYVDADVDLFARKNGSAGDGFVLGEVLSDYIRCSVIFNVTVDSDRKFEYKFSPATNNQLSIDVFGWMDEI